MTTLKSYDLNGKKLSFANWISNLSPEKTPFVSMTGKESIQNTLFQWQTDTLARAGKNSEAEGAIAVSKDLRTTSMKSNHTQILRKVVVVSDTANALANYGRGRELQYQLEKAGKEIKRDLEYAFLNNSGAEDEDNVYGRRTAGIHGLVAPLGTQCLDTGAIVHKKMTTANLKESEIWDMTYNLYLSGSKANIIMFHPMFASFFSSLQEKSGDGANRVRVFENTSKIDMHVTTLVDPLGQEYKLLPNRWMPESRIYFINTDDFTQMVLRSPTRTRLAKGGSYEKWMLEMEVGLRLRHPFAAGILDISSAHGKSDFIDTTDNTVKFSIGSADTDDVTALPREGHANEGNSLSVKFKTITPTNGGKVYASVLKDGVAVTSEMASASSAIDHSADALVISSHLMPEDAGNYVLQVRLSDGAVYMTHGLSLSVGAAMPVSEDEPVMVMSLEPEEPVAKVKRTRKKKGV